MGNGIASAEVANRPEGLAIGALVEVRGQRWVVGDLECGDSCTLVTLQSIEDGRYGDTLEVDLGGRAGPSRAAQRLAARRSPHAGFDPPERLAAFLDAVRWGAVTSADVETAAGAVPVRRRDRGLPARAGRPCGRRAARQPAARRRRRPRQDDRGRAGRPGAAAAPPRPARHGRLPGRADAEVARRDGREVRPRLHHRRLRALRAGAPHLRQRRQPVPGLPADHRQPAWLRRPEGAAPAATRCCRPDGPTIPAHLRPADPRRGAPRRARRAEAAVRRRLAADQADPPARPALRAPAVPVGHPAQRLPGVVHRAAGDARRPALRPRRRAGPGARSARSWSAGSSATSSMPTARRGSSSGSRPARSRWTTRTSEREIHAPARPTSPRCGGSGSRRSGGPQGRPTWSRCCSRSGCSPARPRSPTPSASTSRRCATRRGTASPGRSRRRPGVAGRASSTTSRPTTTRSSPTPRTTRSAAPARCSPTPTDDGDRACCERMRALGARARGAARTPRRAS